MKAKYPNGIRVKVKYGHTMWSMYKGNLTVQDIRPELTQDVATVMYTYGEMSETDHRFSKGDEGYKSYSLKFDKYGQIAWFEEDHLIPIIENNEDINNNFITISNTD